MTMSKLLNFSFVFLLRIGIISATQCFFSCLHELITIKAISTVTSTQVLNNNLIIPFTLCFAWSRVTSDAW